MARLPVVGELAAEPITAQRNDGIGAADGPEHSRHLQPFGDNGLAAGFNDAGTDEELIGAAASRRRTFRTVPA